MFQTCSFTSQRPIVMAVACLLFFGGLTGLSYWNDQRTAADSDVLGRDVRQSGLAIEKPLPNYETKQIGEIHPIVDWVLADNPKIIADRDDVDEAGRYITDFGPLDPPDWRIAHFRLWKDTDGDLNVWLGRPLWYFEELGATEAGQTVWMDMAEFGAVGNAEVISIDQCPQPPPRPSDRHFLVTGRFVHSSVAFLRLLIAGVDEPLDATANHPFWSEDRRSFVAAGDLRLGEAFRLADGTSTHLVSASQSEEARTAYNIEVDGQHTYYVTSAGVLVHNMCASNVVFRNPSTIRFSQNSIKGTFRDGRSIQKLTDGLRSGTIKAGDIPPIRLVERNGKLISIDNRRLQAYRLAGVNIPTRMATPQEIEQAIRQGKFSAGELGAESILIRGGG